MAVPLVIRSQNDLLYAYQLSAAYRSPWVFDPDMALRSEPDIWEIIRNEPVVLAELERRNRNVVRPWRVIANRHATKSKNISKGMKDDSKKLAGIVGEGIGYIAEFNAARRRLADAFTIGRTYEFIHWDKRDIALDGLPKMEWYIPERMTNVDRRRIHWVTDWSKGGFIEKIGVHLEMFDSNKYGWFRISNDMRRNLVEYVFTNEEDRVGYGRGTIQALYFAHYCKTVGVKKMSEGMDRYANGIMKIKLDGLRQASTTKTNEDLLAAAKKVAENYRSEHYMVMEETDDVEIQDAPAGALKFSMEYIRYWDETIARLFNGSVRPSGHGGGKSGARAESETQADTSEAYYQDDRRHLDEILERDLVHAFLYHNWHNIVKLGLDEAKPPHFTSDQIKRQDALTELQINKESVLAGAPIMKSEWYETINRTPPDEDEEVISLEDIQAMEIEMEASKDVIREDDKNSLRSEEKEDKKEGKKQERRKMERQGESRDVGQKRRKDRRTKEKEARGV